MRRSLVVAAFFVALAACQATTTDPIQDEPSCVPGTIVPCYSGPDGTSGVGACRTGWRACTGDGEGYGECVGEVLPIPERCETEVDEDCDGTTLDADAGCSCHSGAIAECYTAAPTTLDVGECHAGIALCDGTGFGPCLFEVTPAIETCNRGIDRNCDGAFDACAPGPTVPGTAVGGWPMIVAGLYGQRIEGLAADAGSSTYFTGATFGPASIGALALSRPGPVESWLDSDLLLGRVDRDGKVLWTARFGDPGQQEGKALAIDGAGNLVVAGVLSGVLNVGGNDLVSAGGWDCFVAKLDAQGEHVWSMRFGGPMWNSYVSGIAAGWSGEVYVGGYFNGTMSVGGTSLGALGGTDAYLAMLDSDGKPQWAKRFGNALNQRVTALALHPWTGDLVTVGWFGGQIDFGSGTMTTAGDTDVFVAGLGADGAALWSKRFGDNAAQIATAIMPDHDSTIMFIGGQFAGSIDFGGGALSTTDAGDGFVTALGDDGLYLWSTQIGGAGTQTVTSLDQTFDEVLVVTGTFDDVVKMPGCNLQSHGGSDVFVISLNLTGAVVGCESLGGPGADTSSAVVIDGFAKPILGGTFSSTVDFDGSTFTSLGYEDGFVIRRSQ